MKALSRYSTLFALLVAAAPFAAKADQISFSSGAGNVTYCVNASCPGGEVNGDVKFNPSAPATNGIVSGSPADTGVFSQFAGAAATFYNFNYLTAVSAASPVELFKVTLANGNSLVYDVTSMSANFAGACQTPACLTVVGAGVYYITNNGVTTEYADSGTNGFTLTAQGGGNGTSNPGNTNTGYVTFSDTNVLTVTPEPSSLLLMGTGLVGMGGALLRRRRGGNTDAVLA